VLVEVGGPWGRKGGAVISRLSVGPVVIDTSEHVGDFTSALWGLH